MITRTFKLCLNAGTGSAPFINVSQTDRDETWLFELYTETGERYIPSSGAIIGIKADGHGIANTGTVDSEGRVVITETEQMTAAAGRSIFELSIDGLTHGTANFIVNVEKKPIDGAIMSDSDLSLISEAVDSAAVIVEVIGDSDPSEVIGEHVDDWLDAHPEATTTVQDGAITAPKINNSLWDKLLVSEEASGNPASFEDGADDVPVSSLKVALEPIQTGSGDPSPTNIRPIYPANGKNLFDVENANILNAYINGSNTITVSAVDRMVYIPILANQQFSVTYTQKALATASQSDDMQIGLFDSIPIAGLTGVRIYNATRSAPTVDMNVSYTGNSSSHTWLAMKIGNTDRTDIQASMATLQIEYGAVTPYQPHQGIMVERKSVNQWDEQWELGGISNQNGTNYGASDRIRSKNYIPCLPNTTYYFKTPAIMGTVAFYNSSQTFISALSNFAGGTFTTPANTKYIRFCGTNAYGATYNNDISINYPSTITDYHAYIGTSYPYTLGREVYGGSVDLATGVLTVDRGIVTMNGSEAWGAGNTNQGFYTSAHTMLKANDYTSVILCDKLKTYERMNKNDYYEATNGITGYIDGSSQYPTQNWIYAKGGGATTSAEFKTWLASNPLQVVYELATPQTIQLTPQEVKTLLGYNNISSSGTVEVIYHADTKLYVDKMTVVDNNIIAPTEETFIATRNYTVNDLVIVNDTLYKCTANIASGSAITPNSNVQQTTLSALIKALS